MSNKPTEYYVQVWEFVRNGKATKELLKTKYCCTYQEALQKVCDYIRSLPYPLPNEYFRPVGTVIIKKLI